MADPGGRSSTDLRSSKAVQNKSARISSSAAGTVVTFGGIAIPCTALLGLCIGGVYLGGSAAYELALSYWAN